MRDLVMKAAIPSYLKAQLLSASSGQGDMKSYSEVGYQLGRYHLDDFSEDPDLVFMVSEGEVMSHPSRILRRIFSSNDHPRGELTDLIPLNQRRDFLIGLLAGASDEEPEDFWLSRLERE